MTWAAGGIREQAGATLGFGRQKPLEAPPLLSRIRRWVAPARSHAFASCKSENAGSLYRTKVGTKPGFNLGHGLRHGTRRTSSQGPTAGRSSAKKNNGID
jgi:hypothetical protein